VTTEAREPRRGPAAAVIWTTIALVATLTVLFWSVAYVEWRVVTSAGGAASVPAASVRLAFLPPGVASGILLLTTFVFFAVMSRHWREPLPVLAELARRIGSGERVSVPYQERADEMGDLAVALRGWQDASALREVLLRSAPVGILRLDSAGVVSEANRAAGAILGCQPSELEGRELLDFVHPEDRGLADRVLPLIQAGQDRMVAEARLRRRGGWLWCSATVASMAAEQGSPGSFVVILEDISVRKSQAEWAAAIQREMLPARAPELDGYEIAARCLYAQEVAGDLYDWVDTGDGQLEFTVADVMGKGMGAALVTAALRTALRTLPAELGPAQRVSRAAGEMTFGPQADSLFVTLFHARLELASGRLRYVDAGHGYCLLRRAGGRLERLPVRSLPLGIGISEEEIAEGVVYLEPGDTLLVCSDGLVELAEGSVALEELISELDPGLDARRAVDRLIAAMPNHPIDDVTVLVLNRAGPAPRRPRCHAP
jgi:PAS domain S-box-containing protein